MRSWRKPAGAWKGSPEADAQPVSIRCLAVSPREGTRDMRDFLVGFAIGLGSATLAYNPDQIEATYQRNVREELKFESPKPYVPPLGITHWVE